MKLPPPACVFRQLIIGVGLLLGSAPALLSAPLPDWITSAAADPSPSFAQQACVQLLAYQDVKYEPAGKVKTLSRHVVRLQAEVGLNQLQIYQVYNADTAHILKVQAWIISPDGKKVETFGKSEFGDISLRRDQFIWDSERVLDFVRTKQVKVGGLIAWEIELDDQTGLWDTRWSFRPQLPTVTSIFEVTPAPGGHLVSHASSPTLPESIPGSAPGSLRWEMHHQRVPIHDLPANFIIEPLMVSVRCLGAGNLSDRLQTWHEFAGVTADIVEKRISAAPSVTEEAAVLIKNKTDRWERIQAIGEFVQKQINYFAISLDKDSLAGYRPHSPADSLKTRLGDCKDKASLMAGLLRSCGENGYVVLVFSGNPGAVPKDWPSASFNHAIVAIPADDRTPTRWPTIDGGPLGKLILFDPTDYKVPFGFLPMQDQGGYGLVVSTQTPDVITLPAETPEESLSSREIEGELRDNGDVTMKVIETEIGASAARTHFDRATNDKGQFTHTLEQTLHLTMPLTKELTWKEDWDQSIGTSKLSFQFTAERSIKSAGPDMLLIAPRLIGFNVHHAAWEKDLQGRIWFNGHTWRESTTLKLPDGFKLGNLPANWKETNDLVGAQISYKVDGNKLLYTCEIVQKPGFLDRKSYESLRALYHHLDESQRRVVIASRTPVAVAP